jgi:hypothetical protein
MSLDDAELGTHNEPPEDMENTEVAALPWSEPSFDIGANCMTRPQAHNLYASHFLSTWNVRTYEFAAVSDRMLLCRELDGGQADTSRLSSRLLHTRILSLLLQSGNPFPFPLSPLLSWASIVSMLWIT